MKDKLLRHLVRVLFSPNSASAKFREKKTLAKISEFTVVGLKVEHFAKLCRKLIPMS